MRERGHPPPFFPPRYGLPAVTCPVCHPPTTNASLRTIVGRCSRPVCLKRNRTCNSNSRLSDYRSAWILIPGLSAQSLCLAGCVVFLCAGL